LCPYRTYVLSPPWHPRARRSTFGSSDAGPRDLPSFPTRRSSDLDDRPFGGRGTAFAVAEETFPPARYLKEGPDDTRSLFQFLRLHREGSIGYEFMDKECKLW